MVVLSVAVPDSFLPVISILFTPSVNPILVVIRPSVVSEKLVNLFPLTKRVTSCQAFIFSVLALKGNTLLSTVMGDSGLINLTAGSDGVACIAALLKLMIIFPLPVPDSLAAVITSELRPSASGRDALTVPFA